MQNKVVIVHSPKKNQGKKRVRQKFVELGIDSALNRKSPCTPKFRKLDGNG
ncbi:hypothetical protein H1P_1010007 [Hyella patelloides LEGE 07179]|uniref:Uncharacterized protein n=1 Tax=Hyella patelloides LEGE 07179 TaxID=945734 RepID=A0A563VIZ9_9CYAN|nr:hypothetical protein H1P_1010007 [Hyella patelloides LEGE 07179]